MCPAAHARIGALNGAEQAKRRALGRCLAHHSSYRRPASSSGASRPKHGRPSFHAYMHDTCHDALHHTCCHSFVMRSFGENESSDENPSTTPVLQLGTIMQSPVDYGAVPDDVESRTSALAMSEPGRTPRRPSDDTSPKSHRPLPRRPPAGRAPRRRSWPPPPAASWTRPSCRERAHSRSIATIFLRMRTRHTPPRDLTCRVDP